MSKFVKMPAPSKEGENGNPNAAINSSTESCTPKSSQTKSLFVHSLSEIVTTQSLTELFSQSYPLKHATVVRDPATKQSRGYGFVTFTDVEDAKNARDSFNGLIFEGRKMKITFAEPRKRPNNDDEIPYSNISASAPLARSKIEPQQVGSNRQQSSKLIIRNLPWKIKEPKQLADLFQSYGKVKHVTLPTKKSGLSAGFGFVVLRGKRNTENALKGMNGKSVEGRVLAVDWAVERNIWKSSQIAAESTLSPSQLNSQPPKETLTGDGLENPKSKNPYNDDQRLENDLTRESETQSEGVQYISNGSDQLPKFQSRDLHLTTCFVRNLPYNATDENLKEHFSSFGSLRYARVVLDSATQRSKGTGFVCFSRQEDADTCLRNAPRIMGQASATATGKVSHSAKISLLEDSERDFSGRYTIEGRVLQISRAICKSEAARLSTAEDSVRDIRDKDRRNLYLLSEGTIASNTPLYSQLGSSEIKLRENSVLQRRNLLRNNPGLHLSLTRLSVRNIPRNITSKLLKALAREAVVGFASDVKAGLRKQLSKEELSRGGAELRLAEKARKIKGKGIVRQAKIVFEGREGKKVSEESGAGRSRKYGFIEYTTHRLALMGLRWLNGQAIGNGSNGNGSTAATKEGLSEKDKRLIVEFAIENVQVVERRHDREAKARKRSTLVFNKKIEDTTSRAVQNVNSDGLMAKARRGLKRKRESDDTLATTVDSADVKAASNKNTGDTDSPHNSTELTKCQRIIGKKRMIRRSRKREKN